MTQQRKIASHTEVLEFLTGVMRRDIEDGIKLSDAMSAADKLHKFHMQEREKKRDSDERFTGIVILPEIKEDEA